MSINQLKQLTVRDASLVLKAETLRSNTIANGTYFDYGERVFAYQQLTQLSGPSFTVDCGANPKYNVIVHTNRFTTAANSYTGFYLLNTLITTDSIVKATILSYDGTYGGQGLPMAFTYNMTPGSVEIGVMNGGNTALDGNFYILVEISKKLVV
jgi:hypothetical protein